MNPRKVLAAADFLPSLPDEIDADEKLPSRDDKDGWQALLTNLYPSLHAAVARFSPAIHPLSVDDVVQDTLIKLWKHHDGLDWGGRRHLRHWLLRVARNAALAAIRRESMAKRGGGYRRVEWPPSEDEKEVAGVADAACHPPLDVAIRDEEVQHIREAFEQLPPVYRDVVQSRLADKSCGEIAAQFGISVDSVKQRLCRARRLLMTNILRHPG